MAGLITQLRLPTGSDIGSNLLQGIEKATRQFTTDKVDSATFEAAAFCLKIGARRQRRRPIPKKRRGRPPLKPMPPRVSARKPPPEPEEEEEEIPQPDWLKPKIYKGEGRA